LCLLLFVKIFNAIFANSDSLIVGILRKANEILRAWVANGITTLAAMVLSFKNCESCFTEITIGYLRIGPYGSLGYSKSFNPLLIGIHTQ
jgi:hypothetical protein